MKALHVILLALVGAAVWAMTAPCASAAPGAPRNLRCEYQTQPMGIDTAVPRLSWEVNDLSPGATQRAYQILVAADRADLEKETGSVWDTGKVDSAASIQVPYAGAPLQSERRYYWTVRTWNAKGEPSPYAVPAFWETGFMNPGDWSAKWITRVSIEKPDTLAVVTGPWIWHPSKRTDKHTIYCRRTIDVPEGALLRAPAKITVDNTFELFVNGKEVGRGSDWKNFDQFDVASLLHAGKNVIAVKAGNETGECGLTFGMTVEYTDGRTVSVASDTEWRVSEKAGDNWTAVDCDDSAWDKAVEIVPYGADPWGKVEDVVPIRSFYVRKDFEAKNDIRRSTARVSGLGIYDFHINGKLVGNDTLDPGWTYYPKRVQYQSFDVTDYLRPGANAVGAVLGNGWWGSGMAGVWRDGDGRFICQIAVEYADGSTDRWVTDDTWKAHETPIAGDSLYHGETYDARLELPGWDTPGYDDSQWSATRFHEDTGSRLVAQVGPAIQVTEELKAVAITEPAPGVYVFDFGQNAAGRTRLKVDAPEGTRVQIRHAEILLPDGNLYTENYRTARATDVYVASGKGEAVFEPRFTYRGFRYAELTGYPGKPDKSALIMRVAHTAAPVAGTFSCSNDLIDQVQHNILWGQRSNLYSVPTDCPQRDERLGWTGDAEAFSPASCWNMDMAGFYTKWMYDILDSQSVEGYVKDVNPRLGGGPAAPGWGDAVCIIPWTVYQFYGDTRILEQSYDGMVAWVEYMRRDAPNDLYEREGYGDWVAPVSSPSKTIGAAYYALSTRLLAKMAAVLGRAEDAAKYGALADRIDAAFNAAYLDSTDNYPGATQTANVLPLAFGITPPDRREAVAANIAKDIIGRDYHLSTGFLGTAHLMPVLTQYGYQAIAYRLATQRTYPSWGYTVDHGATTIWERWNSNQYQEVGPGMNSFNHFAFGAVGQWFYETLAGIGHAEPGFSHIAIHPRPAGDLTEARAAYHSMYGPVASHWTLKDGVFVLEVTIPANSSATVYVPATSQDQVSIVYLPGGDTDGHPAPAQETGAVTFKTLAGNDAVYSVGAGTYRFTSEGVVPE